MRNAAWIVCLATVLIVGSHCRADSPKELTPTLDGIVEKAMKAFRVPGAAIVVVKDDKVIYLKGFGVKEAGKEDKVTPDTVFAIASCSKAFTATLLAMLAEEDKCSWDDRVRKHLDTFRLNDELADREVTLRDLFSHRSGMPRHDGLWADGKPTREELIRRWARGKPSTSFRSTWEYSNVPFTIGGFVAGKIVGSDWETATRKRIFVPLEMKSSSCTHREAVEAKDRATPHYLGFDRSIKAIEWDELNATGPAGSINSTVRDMGNWLRFQLAGGKFNGKQLLAAKALKETHSPQMVMKATGYMAQFFPEKASKFTSYGLGWFVHDHRGHLCVSHGGTLTGFRAQCMMIPEKKIGVFVVGNLRPSLFTETVAKSAIDHLLGLEAEDWLKWHLEMHAKNENRVAQDRKEREKERKRDTRPSLDLEKYAGSYQEPAYGTTTVKVNEGQLLLKRGKWTFRLDHHHYDTFTAIPIEPKDEVFKFDRLTLDVQFRLDKDGAVESLTLFEQTFKPVKKRSR